MKEEEEEEEEEAIKVKAPKRKEKVCVCAAKEVGEIEIGHLLPVVQERLLFCFP
jgi:hypothetical protein